MRASWPKGAFMPAWRGCSSRRGEATMTGRDYAPWWSGALR